MLQSSEYVSIWPAKCYHVTYHVTWWSHNHPIPPLALPHPWPWDDRQIISNQSHNDIPSRIPHTPWIICYNHGEFLSAEWFTMIYLIHVSLFGLFYVSQADGKSHTFIPWLVITFTPWPWQVPKLEVLYHTCIFFLMFFCGGISPYTALT
jgi:hypothetical protein